MHAGAVAGRYEIWWNSKRAALLNKLLKGLIDHTLELPENEDKEDQVRHFF
jgi:hypothetical protein